MAKLRLKRFFASILPASTFGQTALLIGILLFINQLVSYLSVTHYFIGPSYQQINQLISNQVQTLFLQDIDKLSEQDVWRLNKATGIRLHDERSAMHAGLGNATYYDFMSQQVTQQLGEQTEIRVKTGEQYIVWIKPPQQENMWISVPLKGADEKSVSPLTMYFVFIGGLSVAGGWLFVRRLNRPLQALQNAARDVGKGQFPKPLPLHGSSEIIAVTRAFNRMSQGIKQLEHDRMIMTAGISHDLRTPLTRIRLASEMLPNEQDWIKDGIDHDIEDLNDIINQFIDYARQDQQEEMEFCNLNDLVSEQVNARGIESSHIIHLKLSEIPPTKLRKVGLKRVLENLIENAFRYGSEEICIFTRFTDKKRSIECIVRDYGKGIDESKLEDLFSPFAQGDHARGSSGSGLGLAIVKRIIESHGGEMRFSNHQEGGLDAGFTLPIVYPLKRQAKNKQ